MAGCSDPRVGSGSFRRAAFDLLMQPVTALAARWFRHTRRMGFPRYPRTRAILRRAGVLPITDHYYEPRLRYDGFDFDAERSLPGIQFDAPAQLALLAQVARPDELADVPNESRGRMEYIWWNPSFGPGDAEYLYGLLRLRRPGRFIEVGGGYSTLMAWRALTRNAAEGHPCDAVCIEPYENPWLEQLGPRVLRQPLEQVPRELFADLAAGDVLFIDSSHMLRPGGDVLLEILELLPSLRPGVAVHFHDVFTPWHYPQRWLVDDQWLWNEQYVLEAFLSCNDSFRILGALHWLSRRHAEEFRRGFPVYAAQEHPWVPGSFWIERVR